ncbi:hypothetical protein [Nocardioides sp. URHA0020]|uniref:hypothetical protein n=1 Tax=Nocardioides sp. URHA0020 TaxID=1380392 RepID=UPI00048F82FB|nr:hypothetical protein [Nocardioides sp. URHA0020]
MSRSAPRRRAEPVPRRTRRATRATRSAAVPPATPVETPPDSPAVRPAVPAPDVDRAPDRALSRSQRFARSRWPLVLWAVVVLAGLVALVGCLLDVGPAGSCAGGAVAVTTAYAWALAVRTGGRPLVSGGVALALGLIAAISGDDALRTGAAVLTAVVSAVFAVMATVPAVRFVATVREVAIAVLLAAIGALATVGFEPVVQVVRFEYAVLGLALLGAFALVYRLGAGLHGLGRRGVVIVLIGTVVLAITLAYAELLRRYGTPGLVTSLLDVVVWSRDHLGAFPRPLETALGIPALAWGVHMRARRRQGWWVCAFGVAATAPVACGLVNPGVTLTESVLSVTYGAVVGLVVGFVVIRVDLAVTGPRGRRGRRAEEAGALRPEPRRTRALL